MSIWEIILTSICLIDLTVTVLGICLGYFEESNPMLNYFLERWGLSGLILSKTFFIVVPFSFIGITLKFDWIGRRTVGFYYKIALLSYILILEGSIALQLATP